MAEKRSRGAAAPITVAVTGCAGYIGRRVLRLLCADERVNRVLGFDVDPLDFRDPKLVVDRLDVRSPALEVRLKGVDVVIHLAFVMNPIRDETLMRDVNVNGSQNVFRAAGRSGVGKLIYPSSAVAYGAHPDNDLPLTEESPLRANLDFSYAAHKLEVEYVAKEVAAEFPSMAITIFRPAVVLGPQVDSAWSHALEAPLLFMVAGYSPPLQFVHEEDVGRALAWAVFEDLPGAFNLAAPGFLQMEEILAIAGRRKVDLPEPLAFSLAARLWGLGLTEAPEGMLHYVMHPWVMSTDRLTGAGFTCSRSNREALEATLEALGPHVRLGRARVPRSSLRAAGGAGLAALAVAVVAARRRGG